jgi:hypothetical protein
LDLQDLPAPKATTENKGLKAPPDHKASPALREMPEQTLLFQDLKDLKAPLDSLVQQEQTLLFQDLRALKVLLGLQDHKARPAQLAPKVTTENKDPLDLPDLKAPLDPQDHKGLPAPKATTENKDPLAKQVKV